MFSNLIIANLFIFVIKHDNKFIDWIWHYLTYNLISQRLYLLKHKKIHSYFEICQSNLTMGGLQNPTFLFYGVFKTLYSK